MNAAASSWRTCTNRIRSCRVRSASMIPLMPSPGKPKPTSTPHPTNVSTRPSPASLAADARSGPGNRVRPPGSDLLAADRAGAVGAVVEPFHGLDDAVQAVGQPLAGVEAPLAALGPLDAIERVARYALRGCSLRRGRRIEGPPLVVQTPLRDTKLLLQSPTELVGLHGVPPAASDVPPMERPRIGAPHRFSPSTTVARRDPLTLS